MPTFVDPAKPFYVEIEQSELASLLARVARLEETLKDIEQRAESMNWESIAKIASRALEEK